MTDHQEEPPRSSEAVLAPFITVLFLAVSVYVVWHAGASVADFLRLVPANAGTEVLKEKLRRRHGVSMTFTVRELRPILPWFVVEGPHMTHAALLTVETYYRDVIALASVRSLAEFFHLPATAIVGDHKIVLHSESDVENIYTGLRNKYAKEGVTEITSDALAATVVEIHPGLALVKTVASRSTATGALVKTWGCSYLMRELSGEWKCDVLTATPN